QAHRGDVDALLESGTRRDPTPKPTIVVLRAPHGVGGADLDWRVVEQGGRRGEPGFEGGGIDDWLEGAAELAVGLRDAVELAAPVVPAANVSDDRAVPRVERDQRGLERLVVVPAMRRRLDRREP